MNDGVWFIIYQNTRHAEEIKRGEIQQSLILVRSDFGIRAISELCHSRLRGQPVQFNLEINAYLQLSLSNIWVLRECYPE